VQIPSSFYRASSSGYAGSGFDRGHQVPSSHRNNNITDNAVTFLMSNIMPQAPNLNQITCSGLEQYCSALINSGYELYTYSGGYGSGGTGSNGGITYTIASGHMNVPSHFWKVVVALPVGNNDLNRISTSTRVIAVDMPNTQTVNANAWGTYRTSIDAIESATGFDFLSNLPATIQTTLEAIIDNGPTN
jgi:endonuclease G